MHESQRLRATQSPIIPVIADLIRENPGTISLGQGVVGYGPPPEALAAIERFLGSEENHKYQAVTGIPALAEAIAAKLSSENQVPLTPENRLVVTAGGNMAFTNAVLAIADPGDEFILPTPFYFNHEMAITMSNCRPVLVPTDSSYQLDVSVLRAAITPRTRAIVTVSPNNPSGAVYPAALLREVNALCAEHGIFHVHDEAYEYFTYDGAEHFSPASLPGAAGHTLSLFSLSKAYGFASWRIGWMVIPAALESAVRKIQDTVIICPPVISQFAAVGALAAGASFVRQRLRAVADVRSTVMAELAVLERDGICDVPASRGAFYFLLRVRTAESPLTMAQRLIREHRVAVIPGSAFGLERGCHLRVAYGALNKATATEGVGRLAQGLRALVHA